MKLKLVYNYQGEPMEIKTDCANYTCGLPKISRLFQQKHGDGVNVLKSKGVVKEDMLYSNFGDKWQNVGCFPGNFK